MATLHFSYRKYSFLMPKMIGRNNYLEYKDMLISDETSFDYIRRREEYPVTFITDNKYWLYIFAIFLLGTGLSIFSYLLYKVSKTETNLQDNIVIIGLILMFIGCWSIPTLFFSFISYLGYRADSLFYFSNMKTAIINSQSYDDFIGIFTEKLSSTRIGHQ